MRVFEDGTGRGFHSLPSGYDREREYRVSLHYDANGSLALGIGEEEVNGDANVTFPSVRYGSEVEIRCLREGKEEGRYFLTFTRLPLIGLHSEGEIPDEPKIPGSFSFLSTVYEQYIEDLPMGIEVAGGTSQYYPKKSYRLELRKNDECLSGKKKRLLDLRKDDDWVLDASYRDTTFVRNLLSHDLFNAMRPYAYRAEGEERGQAALRGRLAEVVLNGAYNGLYVLQERVDRKMLDLEKIDVEEEGCDELWEEVDFSDFRNGSLLFKAVNHRANFEDKENLHAGYVQKYPSQEVDRWSVLDELVDFVANSSDENFSARVADRFDLENLADYWCLMIAARATDNMDKNYYLARNMEGKFFFVPWDMDATWGMIWTGGEQRTPASWMGSGNRLFERLMALPKIGFVDRVKARWRALRSTLLTTDAIVARFEAYREKAERGGAVERTFERYPDSGGDGSEERDRLRSSTYLREWIDARFAFADEQIEKIRGAAERIPVAIAGEDRVVAPGERVVLDGNASYDPEGTELTLRWTQVAGEEVRLTEEGNGSVSFTAPLTEERLRFELEATDGAGLRAVSSVTVLVREER
jgi:hypothetical protein